MQSFKSNLRSVRLFSTAAAGFKIVVLGGGQQGRVAALNLASRQNVAKVVLADIAPMENLPRKIEYKKLDAKDHAAVRKLVKGADVALTALPGFIGAEALPVLIDERIPVVDVSFVPELPFHLDAQAKKAGVPVLLDVGVAPGMSHILGAALHRELNGLDMMRILVGGMPLRPELAPGWVHAVYFHHRDLIDEYLRPARLRVDGKDLTIDPILDPRAALKWHDKELGPLDSFVSDGLRSLLASYPDVPNMAEITLRVGGHMESMRMLKALGMLDAEIVDATSAQLNRKFPGDAHPDRLVMEVHGKKGDKMLSYRLHCVRDNRGTAMAITTAYSTATAAILLAEKKFTTPGVHPPEAIGKQAAATDAYIADLAKFGVRLTREQLILPA